MQDHWSKCEGNGKTLLVQVLSLVITTLVNKQDCSRQLPSLILRGISAPTRDKRPDHETKQNKREKRERKKEKEER